MYNHFGAVMPLGRRAVMHVAHRSGMMSMDGDQPARDTLVLPGWFFGAVFAVFLVLLPFIFFLSYTLNNLIPTLAMIEDPSPPAYEPLSSNPDDAAEPTNHSAAPPAPVTASIRQTTRMLKSIGGFRSYFRGAWCLIVASMVMSVSQSFFAALMPSIFARLVSPLPAILITLPLTTAWTHIVMSAPKSSSWWGRLPPARRTFSAMWRPAVISWLAVAVCTSVPAGIGGLLNIGDDVAQQKPAVAWKATVAGLVGIVLGLFLIVPTHVLFVRVQASLLPVEDEAIVAFDRSFGGRVEPEVVGGKGFASLADAWSTFTRESWTRLVKLYVKIMAVSIAFSLVVGAIIVPLWVVAIKHATREPAGH